MSDSRHADPSDPPNAERLRSFIGEWVAVRGGDVIANAETAGGVISWLTAHGKKADAIFRVPHDDVAGGGAAPS